jgi:hypothetical protein
MMPIEQLVNGRTLGLAEFARTLAAPDRRALEEGRFLGWGSPSSPSALTRFAADIRLG